MAAARGGLPRAGFSLLLMELILLGCKSQCLRSPDAAENG